MTTVKRTLDPAQARAATSDAPVQLVLAGPGSGKTTTLAARFGHLVRKGIDPRRILAVTFTRKAAAEMGGRIARLLGRESAQGLAIMTFHAFAFRHLRNAPQVAGLPEGFQLWETFQQRHVFHSRQMWWNEDMDIFDIIGGMKERLIDADGFARLVAEGKDTLPDCYPKAVPFFAVYEEALREAGAIDFADMVPRLARAMTEEPNYRAAITGAFDHLLVDEYQDVNPGQVALLDHFVAAGVRLWAVGDDDQTLFAFRASDIRHILGFSDRHAGAPVYVLDRNYRSGADIVEAAKTLIRHNRHRTDKDYQPVIAEPGEIVIRGYPTPEMEARQVAAAIADLQEAGYAPHQMAVLYRSGTVGLPLQTALKERGIPFEVRGSGDLWQSVTARLVIGSLYYLQEGPTVAALSRLGSGRRTQTITSRLDDVRPTVGNDFQAACREVRRIVGRALPGKAAERERNEWATLVDAVVGLAAASGSLEELERRVAEQSAALRNPPHHAVVLSTIHSAKGLEWDAVFLVGLEEGVLPNGNAEDVEEERRIAYVGMTRSRRLLGLTYAGVRYGMGTAPSRFLFELRQADRHVWTGPTQKDAEDRLPLLTGPERDRLRAPRPAASPQRPDFGPDPRSLPPPSLPPDRFRAAAVRPSTEERRRQRMQRNRDNGLPARTGLPWTPDDEQELQALFAAGTPLDVMADDLERKEGAILGRLVQLGLLPAEDPAAAFAARQEVQPREARTGTG